MGYTLRNGILEADIRGPDTGTGSRFDRTGWITQVRLTSGPEIHEFCMPESMEAGRGTGGTGLCGEFGISSPAGYDEAAAGGQFSKIGVGLLTKRENEDYHFSGQYPVLPYSVLTEVKEGSIRFVVMPAECGGYAFRLEKRVALRKASIEIDYVLENLGSRPLKTDEYVHNFLAIDRHPIGPDYRLRFPVPVDFDEVESDYTSGLLAAEGREIGWRSMPDREFYARLPGWADSVPYYWELTHMPSGAGVRESGDFAADRCALWGKSHVVSPEIFISLELSPGSSRGWRRTYEFFHYSE
ncbi:hypothetical protein [Paenibacillus rhizophilus]|uniref:Aldose 1-epimerase n=1 Tax=Paenibacillus rhizophilus TaxID=1850366 RepID=A0A3N9P2I7_9BACL|nr:hypothetical protein [Paenibacillus rhizophilus]RQW09560.1 hypothetical protein EH198_18985 [Paenibacillus rhizophilus]